MLDHPFDPRRGENINGLVFYYVYDVKDMFTEPNECEIVVDDLIDYLGREFGATLQTQERGDYRVVSLTVQGQTIDLQGDFGLGFVYLSAATPEANELTESVAESLRGRYIGT